MTYANPAVPQVLSHLRGSTRLLPSPMTKKSSSLVVLINTQMKVSLPLFLAFLYILTLPVDNVVHILDLKTDVWEKYPTTDKVQGKTLALSGHSAVAKDSYIVIFGGEGEDSAALDHLYYYSLHTDEWFVPEPNGFVPSARTRHAACLSDNGRRMYVSGGLINGKDVGKDLYWFEFETQCWNGPLEFVPRYGHTITMYNNKIWAFGGLTPEMDRVSELSWYDLETDAIGNVRIIPMEDPIRATLHTQGIHMYGNGVTGTMLDVVTAGSAIRNVETSISALDLETLKIRSIISDCSKYFDGYTWHHMLTLGSRLILLGQPGTPLDDERLSDIFTLDLTEFGYMETKKSKTGSSSPTGTIAHDMFEFFNRSELCDFEITAVEGNIRPPLFHSMDNTYMNDTDSQHTVEDFPRGSMMSRASPAPSELDNRTPFGNSGLTHKSSTVSLDRSKTDGLLSNQHARQSSLGIASPRTGTPTAPEKSDLPSFTVSEPIKVHMMVLFARWPHFNRIMSSQMNEFHSRKLYIPEPVAWVRKLVEFMYRDSIDGCNIDEITGLLVLANLYELPRLRNLCIESISKQGITDATAVTIWQRAYEADEEVIRRNAALHCFRHWGQIVRTPEFRGLDKEVLLALCEEADSNAFVSSYMPPSPVNKDVMEEDEELKDEVIPPNYLPSDDPYEGDMNLI